VGRLRHCVVKYCVGDMTLSETSLKKKNLAEVLDFRLLCFV